MATTSILNSNATIEDNNSIQPNPTVPKITPPPKAPTAPKTAQFGPNGMYTYNVDDSGNPYGSPVSTSFNVSSSPVVSSNLATDEANKARAVITNPPTPATYDSNGNLTTYGKSQGLPETKVQTPSTPIVPPTVKTPEQEQSDAVLHEGQTQYFNTTTGQPQWLPSSSTPPAGYTSQDPRTRSDVSDTADAQSGDSIVIKKFSDGTYGRFNTSTGDYTAATAGDFAAAKRVGDANTALDNVRNGVLTPAQQTQIDSLKQQFQALIDKQKVDNANATGATTIAQNLYGLGNTTIGAGAITQVINDGAQKIADLQNKMSTAVTQMMQAFETDDINLLQSAYGQYRTAQQGIQSNIDKTQANLDKLQQQDEARIATQNRTNSIKYHVDIPDNATPQEARDILNTSSIYKYEQETKAGQADPDVTDAQVKYYKLNGVLPSFSYGALGHAERSAFWSAVGGNPTTIIDAASNKSALRAANTAQSKIETLKSGTEASISTLKNGIDIAEGEMNKLFKTGSPFLNKPLQWIQSQLQGNSQYAALNQAISTVASEYAKIKNGASASIAGAPVTSVEEEKKLLNAAMSNGQIESTFDVIKRDSNARLTGYASAVDSIKKDILDLQTGNTGADNDPLGLNL